MNEKKWPTHAMRRHVLAICALWVVLSANALGSDAHSAAPLKQQWVTLSSIQVADRFPLAHVDFNSIDTGAHPSVSLLLDYGHEIETDGFTFTAQTVRYDLDCKAGLLRPTRITYKNWSNEIGHVAEGVEIAKAKHRLGFQDLPIRESFVGTLCLLHQYGFALPDLSYQDSWTEIPTISTDQTRFIAQHQQTTKNGLVLAKSKTVWKKVAELGAFNNLIELPTNTQVFVSAYDCKAGVSHQIITVKYALSGYPIGATLFVGPIDTPQIAENKAELAKSCPPNTAALPDLRIATDMDEGWAALTSALKEGQVDRVNAYLATHPLALNQPIPSTLMTPLEVAIEYEHAEIAEALIAAGADTNFVGPKGMTILHRAAYFNQAAMISLLLKHGALTEVYDDNGRSPLYYAAEHGSLDAAVALVKGGANPDSWNPDQQPPEKRGHADMVPIGAAMSAKNKAVALALIDLGARPNLVDRYGEAPLDYAVQNVGWSDVVKLLLDKGARCDRMRNEELAVDLTRDPESFKLLAQCIQRTTGKVADLSKPISIAAIFGNNDLLKTYLKMGADPNKASPMYNSSLVRLALQSPTPKETIELLVDAGADIKAADAQGTTLLHALAFNYVQEASDVIDLVLKRGGDINAPAAGTALGMQQGDRGYTPLHFAAQNGQMEIVHLLLNRGAYVNATSTYGQTPLMLAIEHQHGDVARLLIEHGAQAEGATQRGPTPLQMAAKVEDAEILHLLLDKGANPNRNAWVGPESQGQTPLTTAIRAGNARISELLLTGGADPNLRDDMGDLPLDLAINSNQGDIAELLRKHQANPELSQAPVQSASARAAVRQATAAQCAGLAQMERDGQIKSKEAPIEENADSELSSAEVDGDLFAEGTRSSMTLDKQQFVIGRIQGRLAYILALEGEHARLLCTFSGKGKATRVQSPAAYLVMLAKASDEDPVTYVMNRPGLEDLETLLDGIRTQPELAFLKGPNGMTAMLYRAIEVRRMDALSMLLERGADPNPSTKKSTASSGGEDEAPILKILRSVHSINADVSTPPTPLSHAAQSDNRIGVRLLLKYGADPDMGEMGATGETPLGSAISHHDRAMVEDLLMHGADPSGCGNFYFQEIIKKHDNEILSLLLAYGFDIGSVNWTLSHLEGLTTKQGNPQAFALVSSAAEKALSAEC